MATLSIHFDPAVIAHLASVDADATVHVTLALGGGEEAPARPAAPRSFTGPLADLLNAELLKVDDVLVFKQGRASRSGRARVSADGQLIVDGHATPFASPSAAASAITGTTINGWTLWRLEETGKTLDELRRERNALAHGVSTPDGYED